MSDRDARKGKKKVLAIDLDRCVECGTCLRAGVCKVGAIQQQPLEWPRMLRAAFSNPLKPHGHTGLLGRGTEEVKTNEVTHRIVRGQVGVAVEMGRPGVGTSLRDIDRLTRAMARHGVEFEPRTPVTGMMADAVRGILKEEVLNERVLSVSGWNRVSGAAWGRRQDFISAQILWPGDQEEDQQAIRPGQGEHVFLDRGGGRSLQDVRKVILLGHDIRRAGAPAGSKTVDA